MSGLERERNISVINQKLADLSHLRNLFSVRCSPCSDTFRQLQCKKIKEQIRCHCFLYSHRAVWKNDIGLASSMILAIFSCQSSQSSLHFGPFKVCDHSFLEWKKSRIYLLLSSCKAEGDRDCFYSTGSLCKYLQQWLHSSLPHNPSSAASQGSLTESWTRSEVVKGLNKHSDMGFGCSNGGLNMLCHNACSQVY